MQRRDGFDSIMLRYGTMRRVQFLWISSCSTLTSHRTVSDVWLLPSREGAKQRAGGTADVRPSPKGLQRLRPASFSALTLNLHSRMHRETQQQSFHWTPEHLPAHLLN